ncbi:multicopper oxidase family protein [Streptomyces sp. NPDC002730]|uniref:multicopper oxidase family protein n=1 Tax=Streptomyces sp. NPDC002730 TaxID=3364662 RepID=UPI003678075F
MSAARFGRRRLLLSVGGAALLAGAGWATNWLVAYNRHELSNAGTLDFTRRLKIPPLLDPSPSGDGSKRYDLTLAPGRTELLPGKKTDTWGANGSYLAPTLRARRGDKVTMNVRNNLPEPTTLHWHGMHLPASTDGGPHQTINAGATWRPRWTVRQPASTLWYHPHPHGSTGSHVYRGVAGMIILDDEESDRNGLPSAYGIDDIPLVIQDKNFHDDGSLDFSETSLSDDIAAVDNMGVLGDTILVNGTYDPYFEVTTRRVRLRLLNGSNARIYQLGFPGDRSFHLVATDNGVLKRPQALTRLRLAPGERAEIVVEFKPGEEAVLHSFKPDLGIGFPDRRFVGGDDTFDIIALRAAATLKDSPPLPTQIAGAPAAIEVPGSAKKRKFTFVGIQINGKTMDMNRVDEVVAAGATEIWEIERGDGWLHAFHLHGATFNVLEVNGREPPAHMRGPKDTAFLPVTGTIKLAVRFDTLTDDKTPYMYHCHVLRHEDQGMMGQFLVVEPGEEGNVSTTLTGGSASHHAHGPQEEESPR